MPVGTRPDEAPVVDAGDAQSREWELAAVMPPPERTADDPAPAEFVQLAQWMARDLIGYGTVRGLQVAIDDSPGANPRIRVEPGVAVSPRGQMIWAHDTTEADGRFRMEGLKPATYSLNINAKDQPAPRDHQTVTITRITTAAPLPRR